jgi:cytochrome c553
MKDLLIIALAFLTMACNSFDSKEPSKTLPTDPEILAQIQAGKSLVETNCYACHSPTASLNGRLAPPMAAVKSHYLDETSTLPAFAAEVVRFLGKPSEEYTRMPGAVKRFGLMPQVQYPEEDLRAIAAYVFYADLEQPDWFEKHQLEEKAENMKEFGQAKDFAKQGRRYAMQTKSVLGSNLLKAIKSGGPEHAVTFCNIRAETLTDSSGTAQNVSIRRVSDRPRNPVNAADSMELAKIIALREDLAGGISLPYRLHEEEQTITGYYPIVTNDMCLKCHGEKGENIAPTTLSALEALYPDDKATGYAANQLRGIWVVEMPKK